MPTRVQGRVSGHTTSMRWLITVWACCGWEQLSMRSRVGTLLGGWELAGTWYAGRSNLTAVTLGFLNPAGRCRLVGSGLVGEGQASQHPELSLHACEDLSALLM